VASKDLARILKKMDRLATAPRDAIRRAIETGAAEVTAMQRHMVQEDDGDLKGSIRTEDGEHDLQTVIAAGGKATTRPVRNGADADYDYALANEFGTSDMTARPFFYPAWRLMKRRVVGRVNRVARKAIREVWDK
jgi:HK97 gp10 family phage protein